MEQQKQKTQDALKPLYSELNELEEQVRTAVFSVDIGELIRGIFRSKTSCRKYQARKQLLRKMMSVYSRF